MAFADDAPTLNSLGITLVDVDAVVVAAKPVAPATPTLNKALVLLILADFADVTAANGFKAIAQKHSVTTGQVKALHKEFLDSRTPA